MIHYSQRDFVTAAVMKLSAAFLFATMAVQVRYLGDRFPVGQVIFFRAIFAFVPILIFYAALGELSRCWQTKRFGGHVQRGTLSIASAFCYFAALARLPIVDVTAISFVTPLIVVVLAAIFLKEVVHIYRWSAVIVGFSGVIVMLIPYLDVSKHAAMTPVLATGLALAICNAVFSAIAVIQVRRLTRTETTSSIVIYFSLFIAIGGLVTLPFGWIAPNGIELGCLIGAGIAGGAAHIISTSSHHYAPASFLVSFDYSSMIWGFLLGYLFFGEVPATLVAVGAVIVAGAGLFVVWRERQLGLKRPKAEQEIAAPRG
ncbi:DMT family transporter [Bradyrhizobium sp. LHD-71]|uniref:DMT family transporter n=1 Tax=Bradyrhizobium sp. LHD-71 TaxID=3072141 RepID=UPI00280D8ED3|nr:DMT family transporter [Bradyrhizobium sp. LHD-71]MDQ8728443.1 DMT family transporter [Bradyrhizobium sp. LHD-71]